MPHVFAVGYTVSWLKSKIPEWTPVICLLPVANTRTSSRVGFSSSESVMAKYYVIRLVWAI